jgi:hypothetical protein
MRASLLIAPLLLLGLAGCVDVVHDRPARETTVVTPAQPPMVYAAPGTSATVVTRP